jgi:hypothetical protein
VFSRLGLDSIDLAEEFPSVMDVLLHGSSGLVRVIRTRVATRIAPSGREDFRVMRVILCNTLQPDWKANTPGRR